MDADELAREVVAPGSDGLAAVVHLLGPGVLRANGNLDRAQVASRVFGNPETRLALEAILHPRIQEVLKLRLRALQLQGEALACYEAPLLVEVGRADSFRPLVVVVAHQNAQLQRVLDRDGLPKSEVLSRISAQATLSEKAAAADIVIANDGTLDELQEKADLTLTEVCRRLGAVPSHYEIA